MRENQDLPAYVTCMAGGVKSLKVAVRELALDIVDETLEANHIDKSELLRLACLIKQNSGGELFPANSL